MSTRSYAHASGRHPKATRCSSRRWWRSFGRRRTERLLSRLRSRRCSPRASTSSNRMSGRCSSAARSKAGSSTGGRCRPWPEEPQVMARLTALVRKELVRPDKPQLPGEDAFRFRHLLIRDAAYNALPKATRAELHERFADWLGEHGSTLVELDEILGYHLEQAYRYRTELGALDDHAKELGTAASTRLAASGERALARGDMSAAGGFLEQATALLEPEEEARLRLLPQLGYALLEAGQLTRAETVLAEAGEAARRAGDRGLEASVVPHQVGLLIVTDPQTPFAAAQAPLRAAAETFEELGDEAGLARASGMLAQLELWQGSAAEAAGAFERAAEHARRAGDRRLELDCLEWINGCLLWGPAPAEEAIRRSEAIERAGDRRVEAWS